MSEIEERVKRLKQLAARHRGIYRIRASLIPSIQDALDELEAIFMRISLTLPELEGRIKEIEKRLKTLEDEIAYLEKVMAKNDLFKVMVEEDETNA